MQQSASGDNQQATVSEAEKGWLAGIIDGEGSLHIDLDTKGGAHPYLNVTNTDRLIIEKVADVWQRLGIGCRVSFRKGGEYDRNPKWNIPGDVMVIGYKRLKPALIAIMPYLVGKSDQALLMYTFVESRLANFNNHSCNKDKQIKPEEMAIIKTLKDAKHHHRVLRDYMPNNQVVEDIVRATRRRVEDVRNAHPRLIVDE